MVIRVRHANSDGALGVIRARNRGWAKLAAVVSSLAIATVGLVGANLRTAQAAPTGTLTTSVDSSQVIEVDAIKSGKITDAGQLSNSLTDAGEVVSGRASIVTPIAGGQLQATYDSYEAVPDDVPVYLQWIDSDGAVSPIYKAFTHELPGAAGSGGPGMYAFELPTWTDAAGKVHHYQTGINQRYRVFSDAVVTNPATGGTLQPLRDAPGYTPYAYGVGSGDGLGEFPGSAGTSGNMTRTGLWFYEEPGDWVKSANPIEDAKGPLDNPVSHYDETSRYTFSGNVWLELGDNRQLYKSADSSGGDPAPSDGYQVWASTLTAEGKAANAEIQKLPNSQWAQKTKEMLQQHPEYIAATVHGPIKDGKYTLRFPSADVYDQDNVYMWVTDPQGNVSTAYSTFTQPVFQNPRFNLALAPTADPSVNNAGLANSEFKRSYNVNFAIVQTKRVTLDITNYNTTNKPAQVGNTANLTLKGDLSPLPNKIEWRDPAGKIIKTCEGITTTTDLKGCESFEVPATAKNGDIYTAVLISGSQEVSADAFIVYSDDDGDGSTGPKDPDPDNSGKPGTGDPADRQNVTHGVKLVDGDGKAIAGKNPILSDGSRDKADAELRVTYKKAQNSDVSNFDVTLTDKDGKVADANAEETDTVSAWRGAKGYPVVRNFGLVEFAQGTYAVAVTEDIDYWAVTKASQLKNNGSLEVTGLTPNQFVELGYDSDNNGVADVDEKPQNERFDPTYQDSTTPKDQPLTIPAPKDDPNGELKGNLPAGTTFALGQGAPQGITIDPATGVITVPANTFDAGVRNIPVVVTYPDGTVDNINAKVTVTEAAPTQTDADRHDPGYEPATGKPGETVRVPQTGDKNLPAGSTFTVTGPGMTVDPATGEVSVVIPGTAKPGDKINGTVTVTYPDKSTDTVPVVVTVVPTDAQKHAPVYTPITVAQGATATVAAPVAPEGALPSGTTFTPVARNWPAWATIDGNTGAITVKPGLDVKPGGYTARVDVHYPDGSADTINATVTVTAAAVTPTPTTAETTDPGTGSASGKPGATVPVAWTGDTIPGGATVVTTTPGWTFTVGNDGKVTVTIPGTAQPGEVELPVTVTYPDGSKDTTTVTVTVLPTDAQKYAPAYADLSVQAGSTKAGQAPADPTQALPQGTTFAAVTGTFPAWAQVDPTTGVITASPAADVAVGNYSTPRVLVAYPDGTTDTVPAKIVVTAAPAPTRTQAEQYSPAYTEITVKRGETGTVAAPTAPEGALPQGTTFKKVANVNSFPAWGAVDPDTGVITVKPTDAVALRRHMFRVDVLYPDGSADTINAFVTVTEADTVPTPGTGSASGKPGATVPVAWTGTPIPGGATVVTTTPGWTLTVDPDTGVTSVVIPGTVTPGKVELPVTVTYPDGKTVDTTVTVTVVPTDAQKYAPAYEDLTVAAGSTKSGKAPADPTQTLPQGVKFEAKAGTFPAWAQVDPTTGVITASPSADVTPGTYSTGRVVVTYQDGSADTISAKIIVTEAAVNPTQADQFSPAYTPTTVKQGETATVPAPVAPEGALPTGTTFTPVASTFPAWATIDGNTGAITVKPGLDVKSGDYTARVDVHYPDGSADTINATITVVALTDAERLDPGTGSATGEAGASVPVEWTGDSIPGGSTVGTTTPGWTFDVDDQGRVTVHIPGDAKPGKVELPVTVTYPDGSQDTTTVTVTVVDNTPKPGTGSATGTAGSSVPVEWTGDSIPGGSTITGHNPGWTFTVDTKGKVTVTFPGDVKPGKVEIPVTITYPDGKTVDTTVTVTVTAVKAVKTTKSDAPLPGTGADGLPVALAAALLTLAGVGVAVLRRRRNA